MFNIFTTAVLAKPNSEVKTIEQPPLNVSKDKTPQTKPLSDEEIEQCYWGDGYPDNPRCPKDFARAIEERHGIK